MISSLEHKSKKAQTSVTKTRKPARTVALPCLRAPARLGSVGVGAGVEVQGTGGEKSGCALRQAMRPVQCIFTDDDINTSITCDIFI